MDSIIGWIKKLYNKHLFEKLQAIQPRIWVKHIIERRAAIIGLKRYPNYLAQALSYEDWEPRLWPKRVNGRLSQIKISRRILSDTGQRELEALKNEQE